MPRFRNYVSITVFLLGVVTLPGYWEGKQTIPLGFFAFTHVTVIDATGSPAQPDVTVVVNGGKIAAIGKSAELAVPQGAQTIDATGKYLVPGFVDMHVHTTWDKYFVEPLMLANGITGMREMFATDITLIRHRQRQVSEGALLSPEILAAGPIVDGSGAPWPNSTIVTNAVGARAAVAKIKSQGFD